MTRTHPDPREQALAWFVALQDVDASEADWLAYREWLEASPANSAAYSEIEAAWIEIEGLTPSAPAQESTGAIVPLHSQTPRRISAGWLQALGVATAIAAAALIFIIQGQQDHPQIYKTTTGQIQTVSLEDGSRIVLNRASEIAVRIKHDRRTVTLIKGEAAFDIAHDAKRPFVVSVGDRAVTVLGTEFNILRHAGQLVVTVKRGIVAVSQAGRAPEAKLVAGQQLSHTEGTSGSKVDEVDPENALAWRQRLLIYHNRPLIEVSRDLSRYFGKRVVVDPSALPLRFTGSLRIDQQETMLQALETFLPVKTAIKSDEIHLMARETQ